MNGATRSERRGHLHDDLARNHNRNHENSPKNTSENGDGLSTAGNQRRKTSRQARKTTERRTRDQGRPTTMKMPFGKHKDKEVHTVPHDYLLWFRNNITNLNGDLLKAVIAGLDGKRFDPQTIKERVDEAKKNMLERLKSREMAC
jgi:hypothetical protein